MSELKEELQKLAGERSRNLRGALNRYFQTDSTDTPLHVIEIEGNKTTLEGYVIGLEFDSGDFLSWLGVEAILHVEKVVTKSNETFAGVEIITPHSKALHARPGNVIVKVTSDRFGII